MMRLTLTLTRPSIRIISSPSDLPFCLVVHFNDQHDGQVPTTGRGTLLGSSLQQSGGTTS